MIILRSRSLIIPNDEYNLGNDYDTNTATRVFQLDRVMEGIDLANLMFKLDLTYADGTSDTLALDSEVTDDKINLTWTVTKNQLHVPGTVVVQIRALNVDGNMKWTSYIGAFFVEASMFGSADYSGKLTEVEQFEVAIKSEKERVQNEKARQDAEAERVQAEAERKPAEEERKTAEAERKSAETVRSNAETARESAETEREEWYNSAKTNFDAAIASGDKAEQIANSLETNVDANMKAAAASATAAAGSASAAAGSANEAKQYSQNWSALDQRVTKNADDIAATNNNLSKYWSLGADAIDIPSGSDMHTYLSPGNYRCQSATIAKTLTNCPFQSAFTMKVYYSIGSKPSATDYYILQEYTRLDGGERVLVYFEAKNNKWDSHAIAFKNDLSASINARVDSRLKIEWSNDPVGLLIIVDKNNKRLIPSNVMTNIS